MPRVNQLPAAVIVQMILWAVPSYPKNTQELDQISAKHLRTVVMLVIQYYCLARVADIRILRAADLSLITLEGNQAIEIYFRAMKNDQLHHGSTGYIVAEGGATCPYQLIKLFFGRFSFFFNDGQIADANFLLPRLKMARETKIMIADGSKPVCQSTLVSNIKELAALVGFEPTVSAKSAKIAGTSAAFINGLSDADIRDKGRWKSLESALHYRRLSDAYKLKLAKAISIQTEFWDKYPQIPSTINSKKVYDPLVQFRYIKPEQVVKEKDAELEEQIEALVIVE